MKDSSHPMSLATHPSRGAPWQIWITVLFLCLEGVGNLVSITVEPAAATWLAAKCIFVVGLIRGWRLVFVWFEAVGVLHVLSFHTLAPFIAFLNLVLVLLVGSAMRHFFPRDNPGAPALGAKPLPPGAFDREFDV